MIVGFTGTRKGMTQFQREKLREILLIKNCSHFIHGDCVGSDEVANEVAQVECNVKMFSICPPEISKLRAFCFDPSHNSKDLTVFTNWISIGEYKVRWFPVEPYLERNKRIVRTCDLLIATPKEYKHEIHSGTWATIRFGWKNQKDVIIIPPVERPEDIDEDRKEKEEILKRTEYKF